MIQLIINIEFTISITKFRRSCPKLLSSLSFLNFITHVFVAKKLDDLIGPLRLGNGSLTEYPKIMSETFTNEFSSVYFTGNLNSPAVHQALCGKLGSIVIINESVCWSLSILDVEASMGPDGFHPKLLSSCQAFAYPIYLIFKKFLQCDKLPLFKKGSRYSSLNYRPINT